MNTLFNTIFENEEASHYEQEVQLRPQTYDLQESNVNLKLTIVHTVGFGDQINKEERYSLFIFFLHRIKMISTSTEHICKPASLCSLTNYTHSLHEHSL